MNRIKYKLCCFKTFSPVSAFECSFDDDDDDSGGRKQRGC